MTTQSIFGVAGPFTILNPLTPLSEVNFYEKMNSTQILSIPANNIVTEIFIKKKDNNVAFGGGALSTDLTPNRGIGVGLKTVGARLFTGTPGALTNILNSYDITSQTYPYTCKLDPIDNPNDLIRSFTQSQEIVCQSAFGGNITSGSIAIVVKYKPFSDSVVDRFNNLN